MNLKLEKRIKRLEKQLKEQKSRSHQTVGRLKEEVRLLNEANLRIISERDEARDCAERMADRAKFVNFGELPWRAK